MIKRNVFRFETHEVQANNSQDITKVLLKMTPLKQILWEQSFLIIIGLQLASQSRKTVFFQFKSTKVSFLLLKIALKAELLSNAHEYYYIYKDRLYFGL